jgi:drug/metabolite transporter (DMT)-like permease
MLLLPGILTGLCCAFSHSACYLASKHHAVRHPGRTAHLLLFGHLMMAVVSVPLTVLLWPETLPPLSSLGGFLAGSILFYAASQGVTIRAMHHTEPSRVSPLLGIKVLLMGLFAWGILGTTLSLQQQLALALCTLGAIALGLTGERLPLRAAVLILMAASGYVLSDLCIHRLVRLLTAQGQPLLPAALFALGLTYSTLALCSLILSPFLGGIRNLTRHPRDVAPFALFWLGAMAFYYVTLGLVGPVFGVVLQSTRGLFSVLLGALLHRLALHGALEQALPRAVFYRRFAAAALMFSGIVLYATG